MPKLTVNDIVPGELYVFADINPYFSSWVGLIARATHRYKPSSTRYVFELIKLADETCGIGYAIGTQLSIDVERFERYQLSASDQLFN
jgi:hypothetical protein